MAILYQIQQVVDENGGVTNVTAEFYQSGTTTPREVFSDKALTTSLGVEVSADNVGRFEPIYFTDGNYRILIKNTGAVLYEYDTLAASDGGSAYSTVAELIASTAPARGQSEIWQAGGYQLLACLVTGQMTH